MLDPQRGYCIKVDENQKKCKLEEYGFLHNKAIYSLSNELLDNI